MLGTRLKHLLKSYLQPSAQVLMYHRVAAPSLDVWDIAVHPKKFEQQLQVLQQEYRVMPLPELLDRCQKNKLPRKSLAITFDDGYQDNFLEAKPLLEKYDLPATFFIATSTTDTENAFWWDELEELILGSEHLPSAFKMPVAGVKVEIDLREENLLNDQLRDKLSHWKAFVHRPETVRSQLFLRLWQSLRPLSHEKQQHHLTKIKEWAGGAERQKTRSQCMSSSQLHALVQNPLFDVGGHTSTHPLLSSLGKEQQYLELKQNRDTLQQITECAVGTCSYPYGAYTADSMAVAQELGFTAAFTTQEKSITHHANPFQLGRIQVPNLEKKAFQKFLQYPR